MILSLFPLLAAVMVLACVPAAYAADCSNPSKPESTLLYNQASHVLQYCDGTNWIATGTATTPNGDTTTGLVGWWKLDEGSGTTVADASGNGNTGTLTNGATWTTGQFNSAVNLDGTNDYVSIANESNFDFERTQAFNISAWVNRTSTATEDDIVEKVVTGSSYRGYTLWLSETGAIPCSNCIYANLNNNDAGLNNSISVYTSGVSTGSWHHIVMTYNGSSQASSVKIYVDGVSQSITILRDTLSGTILNNNNLLIGDDIPGDPCCFFGGKIDDVRIYNRALSAADVAVLYVNGFCASPTGPERTIRYNADQRTLQYCNGQNWIGMAQVYTA
jgi:hypothetical protein